MKICNVCKKSLPLSKFYANPTNSKDGRWPRCKECSKANIKRLRAEYRKRVYDHYGNKCNRCGFADERAFVVDHVKGDGYLDKNEGGTRYLGSGAYLRVLKEPERFQLLCANCNTIKAREAGEFSTKHTKGKTKGWQRRESEELAKRTIQNGDVGVNAT